MINIIKIISAILITLSVVSCSLSPAAPQYIYIDGTTTTSSIPAFPSVVGTWYSVGNNTTEEIRFFEDGTLARCSYEWSTTAWIYYGEYTEKPHYSLETSGPRIHERVELYSQNNLFLNIEPDSYYSEYVVEFGTYGESSLEIDPNHETITIRPITSYDDVVNLITGEITKEIVLGSGTPYLKW